MPIMQEHIIGPFVLDIKENGRDNRPFDIVLF
jgi:hypothetical protein